MGGREWDDLGLRLSYNRIASLTRRLHLSGKVGVRGMEVGLGLPVPLKSVNLSIRLKL